ncbi:hypothetical protein GOB27_27210 [Sinorhizobium meliloti]|nr:hypothetical protein [Sinorhizobium meliloti]
MRQQEYAFGPDTPGPARSWRPIVSSTESVVVAGHPLAAKAAADILAEGGNAVDAGVAAGMVLAVVESPIVGFSGVAPSLVYQAADDEVLVSSGVGTWPAAATSAAFRDRHGGLIPKGVLRTVVPAAPHVWIRWLKTHGTVTFGRAAEAAMRKQGIHAQSLYRTHHQQQPINHGGMAVELRSIPSERPHSADWRSVPPDGFG